MPHEANVEFRHIDIFRHGLSRMIMPCRTTSTSPCRLVSTFSPCGHSFTVLLDIFSKYFRVVSLLIVVVIDDPIFFIYCCWRTARRTAATGKVTILYMRYDIDILTGSHMDTPRIRRRTIPLTNSLT